MRRERQIRLAGVHASRLTALLFPGDGREAVALALCGQHLSTDAQILTVHDIIPVPPDAYVERHGDRVTWRTGFLPAVLERADREGLSILKVHSHPSGFAGFSRTDDRSDSELFESVFGWVDEVDIHGSVIALPDGSYIGRFALPDGGFCKVDRVLVSGERIQVFDHQDDTPPDDIPAHAIRHALALGAATTRLLRRLRVGVVGCSGTGSIVAEQLLRLGVGELVAVDPDLVEDVNLNRIVNSTMSDALSRTPKVDVIKRTAHAMDLGTKVVPFQEDLRSRKAVSVLASCDVIFGCVDSHDGRRSLNRIATYYVIPYIDVGVLVQTEESEITHISGAVHYLQPGASSLLSRGVINNDQASTEALERDDPELARGLRHEGYLRGAGPVARPAVIAINGVFASMAVFELLARLHGFRPDDAELSEQRFCLTDYYVSSAPEGESCDVLRRHLGRGDVEPLLDMPELSEG